MAYNNEKSYEEIMQEINTNLTDDKEMNFLYLVEISEKYKNHPLAKEILRQLGRLIYDNSDDQIKEEYEKIYNDEFHNKYNDALKLLLDRNNFSEAKKKFEEVVKVLDTMYKDDSVSKYYSLRTPIDLMLLRNVNKDRQIKNLGEIFTVSYMYLGVIAFESQDFDSVEKYIDESLKWDPYNTPARWEKIETYKVKKELEKFYEETIKAYEFIYIPSDLARYYRNLGYYFVEKEEYHLANNIFVYSLAFENEKMVYEELLYIKSKTKKPIVEDMNDCRGFLSKNNIPLGISEKNVTAIIAMMMESISIKDENVILFCKNLLKAFSIDLPNLLS
jgi:tetratricopeptide (TPR) repeat protein